MKKGSIFFGIIFGILAYFLVTIDGLQAFSSQWPSYQHDAQHTGRSEYAGPQTNELNWIYDIITNEPNCPGVSQPVIGADGVIYLTVGAFLNQAGELQAGKLYAINHDKTMEWPPIDLEGSWFLTPAIAPDGTIYLQADNGIVYVINSNGTEKWRFNCESGPSSYAAIITIGPDGVIYVPTWTGLYAINPDGTKKWHYQENINLHNKPWANFLAPAIGLDGAIYAVFPGAVTIVDDAHGIITALYPDGTIKWKKGELSEGGHALGVPSVGADGTIYVAGTSLFAHNPSNGDLIWERPICESGFGGYYHTALTPTIAPNGTIIAGVTHLDLFPFSILRAFNPQGDVLWTFEPAESYNYLVNPVIDKQGTVFVPWIINTASSNLLTRIYWIDSTNGTIIQSFDISKGGPAAPYAPSAIGSNGLFYIPLAFSDYSVSPEQYSLKLCAFGTNQAPEQLSANVDGYSPDDSSNPIKVEVGNFTPISMTFTNTGNIAWKFIAGASVWDSDGNLVGDHEETLSVPLEPGQQYTASWNHTVNQAGDYWLQFGVWKDKPFVEENLLNKKPDPSQKLIIGVLPNQPPNKPINISPPNGSTGITLTSTLQSSPFSDPDIGNIHTASQWQITTVPGHYSPPAAYLYDSGVDTQNLYQTNLPSLAENTTYYWHVRYQDNHEKNAWSEWSAETSFTMISQIVDLEIQEISFHCCTMPRENFLTCIFLSKANEIVVAAKIHNKGNTEARNIQLKFLDEGSSGFIGMTELSKLEPGKSIYLDVMWVLSTDILNHKVQAIVSSTIDDSYPEDNKLISNPISIYYASEALGTSSLFDLKSDAYSFSNEELTHYLKLPSPELWLPEKFWLVRKAIGAWVGGYCLGMSSSVVLYKEHPEQKPSEYGTVWNDMKMCDTQVTKVIEEYQLSAPAIYPWSDFGNPNDELDKIIHALSKSIIGQTDNLVLLTLKNDGVLGSGIHPQVHSVVAYKIIDLGSEKRVYFYDPNTPMDKNDSQPQASIYLSFIFTNNNIVSMIPKYDNASIERGFSSSPLYDYNHFRVETLPFKFPDKETIMNSIQAVFDSFNNILKTQNLAAVMFASPIDALLTDHTGRRIGYVGGSLINEIPGSNIEEFSHLKIYYVPAGSTYSIETLGTGDGTLDLYYMIPKESYVSEALYENIPVSIGSKTFINMGQQIMDYTMKIDSNGDGAIDEARAPSYYFENVENVPPVAEAGSDQKVIVNETVQFDGSGSSDSDGSIISYQWNFDDGVTESGATVNHIYAGAGTYTVDLEVKDNYKAIGTDKTMITVLTPAEAINDLVTIVQDMNLQKGINNSLDSKLQAAKDSLLAANAGNREDAVNKLQAFINAVEAQRGKELTNEQANQLVGYSTRIIASLSTSAAPSEIPREFKIVQNYPNPFNPDTWIPYQLAEDVDVIIRIYDASGLLVKTFNLGHKPAGFYINKDKAAYWDGKNEAGEEASFGVYFYTIQAGDLATTRKMLMLK